MGVAIVDSNILMDYEKDREEAVDWWEARLGEGWRLNISIVTYMEWLQGWACNGKNASERIEEMRREEKIHHILPVTRDICGRTSKLMEQYCLTTIPPHRRDRMQALICDMFIAATALQHGFVLFTRNSKDFQWINALNVQETYLLRDGETP